MISQEQSKAELYQGISESIKFITLTSQSHLLCGGMQRISKHTFSSQFQWNRVYAITQFNGFSRTSFFIRTVSFIYSVFSQVQETKFVLETIYIIPLCPFRDSLFFALLILLSSYLLFNYTYCFAVLQEHLIRKAKRGIYNHMFISLLQTIGENHNLQIHDKYIENVAKTEYLGTKITSRSHTSSS